MTTGRARGEAVAPVRDVRQSVTGRAFDNIPAATWTKIAENTSDNTIRYIGQIHIQNRDSVLHTFSGRLQVASVSTSNEMQFASVNLTSLNNANYPYPYGSYIPLEPGDYFEIYYPGPSILLVPRVHVSWWDEF